MLEKFILKDAEIVPDFRAGCLKRNRAKISRKHDSGTILLASLGDILEAWLRICSFKTARKLRNHLLVQCKIDNTLLRKMF